MRKPLLWLFFFVDILRSNLHLLRRPFRLFIVVTKKCHSRCQHCKIWQETPKDELTLDDYTKIAMQSPWLKWLHLTGGEPTDRDDFADIITTFHKHCKKLCLVNFTTNGLEPQRIEATVRKIAVLGIPRVVVSVSIDGPPAVNDSLRGIDGDFDRATETLKRLRGLSGIQTQVSMTLFKKNKKLIQETFLEIQKRIPDFKLGQLNLNIPHTSPHFFGNDKMRIKAEPDILTIIRKYRRDLGLKWNAMGIFKNSYFRHLPRYFASGKSPVPCTALSTSVYISEKGSLFPCTIWSRDLGTLKDFDYDVVKALRSPRAIEARAMIANQQCPNCWTPCEAFSSTLSHLHRLIL